MAWRYGVLIRTSLRWVYLCGPGVLELTLELPVSPSAKIKGVATTPSLRQVSNLLCGFLSCPWTGPLPKVLVDQPVALLVLDLKNGFWRVDISCLISDRLNFMSLLVIVWRVGRQWSETRCSDACTQAIPGTWGAGARGSNSKPSKIT